MKKGVLALENRARKNDGCLGENDDCLSFQNFREASLYLNEEVLHFSKDLGIDLHKPNQLNAFVVEENQVMYSDHYYLCGEIFE